MVVKSHCNDQRLKSLLFSQGKAQVMPAEYLVFIFYGFTTMEVEHFML